MIRPVREEDASQLQSIYNYYVENTAITFEETPLSLPEMTGRIRRISAAYPWLVAEEEGRILGYAYASRWKERSAYRYTVETTVYLAPDAGGRGVGSALYEVLIPRLRREGYRSAMAVITLPNEGSERLHDKFAFRKAGHFREVGFKFKHWLDVEYRQLDLTGGS